MHRARLSLAAFALIFVPAAHAGEAAPAAAVAPEPSADPDVIDDAEAGTEVLSHFPTRLLTQKQADEIVDAWRRRADGILAKAKARSDGEWAATFGRASKALGRARFKYPRPGMDLKGCKERILAFVIPFVPTIHVCASAVYGGYDERGMAQIVIHESAHVARQFDECDATRTEVAAMRQSGEGLAFRNGYWQRCGMQ